jgi:hypothetical protein
MATNNLVKSSAFRDMSRVSQPLVNHRPVNPHFLSAEHEPPTSAGAVFELGIVVYPLRIIDFSIVCKVLGDFLLKRVAQCDFVYDKARVNSTTRANQPHWTDSRMKTWHFGQLMKMRGLAKCVV